MCLRVISEVCDTAAHSPVLRGGLLCGLGAEEVLRWYENFMVLN